MVARLEQAAIEVARDPIVAARLQELGAEVVASTGVELAATIREESGKWAQVVREAGIRSDLAIAEQTGDTGLSTNTARPEPESGTSL